MKIVSGFISGINGRSDRDLTKYILLGKELMACQIPMIIFLERYVSDLIFFSPTSSGSFEYKCEGGVLDGMRHRYSYSVFGHITVVFFEKTDLFLWPYKSLANKFSVNTGNPSKDTLEYMMVQCQKTEWLSIACSLCVGSMEEIVWMDFGIFHMFNGKIDVFQTEIYKMRSRVSRRVIESITIASCMSPKSVSWNSNFYRDVVWLFAGSVFGGGRQAILRFAYLMREKCFQVLREKNTLMWEINIWALLYKDFSDFFNLYTSNHSDIILRGYS